MNRMTISRFAVKTGIPQNQLDHVLVSWITGDAKNLTEVYKSLKREKLIREAAKASGKSFADIMQFLNTP